jgi:hypothetical protein
VGAGYRVESREQAGTGDWTSVESVILQRSPQIWTDTRPDRQQMRIYRAVKE